MQSIRKSLVVRLLALIVLLAITGAIAFGYLGWIHLAFDSFAHVRLHLAAALGVMALVLVALRLRIEALFAFAVVIVTVASTIGTRALPGIAGVQADAHVAAQGPVYRLLHMNLRFDNREPEQALSLIGQMRPDIVSLNEVSQMWRERLVALEAAYPHMLYCPPATRIGGTAILSRRPFATGSEPQCRDRGAVASAQVDLGGRIVHVATLHMGWPWPFAQPWQLPRIAAALGSLDGTAILAGDFNATPWSHAARTVADSGKLTLVPGIRPTWLPRALPEWLRRHAGFPIDHVAIRGGVVSAGISTTSESGSDHLPILFEFMLLPAQEPGSVLQAMWARDAAVGNRQWRP